MSYDARWNNVSAITGINLNSAGSDNAIVMPVGIAKWGLVRLRVYDTSTSLAASIATLGLYTGTGGTGTALVAPATLTSLTSATKFVDMTLSVTSDYQTVSTVYVRNVTAHGLAATCGVALFWEWMG